MTKFRTKNKRKKCEHSGYFEATYQDQKNQDMLPQVVNFSDYIKVSKDNLEDVETV